MTVRETETPGILFVGYWVDARDPLNVSCDCAAACLSDRTCLHIRAAQEHLRGEPVTHWRTR